MAVDLYSWELLL